MFKQKNPNPKFHTHVEIQTREFLYCVVDLRKEKNRTPRMVRWTKPPDGWLALNTNGSVICSTGLAGGGGLIRYSRGHCVMGFAKACLASSSIIAEL